MYLCQAGAAETLTSADGPDRVQRHFLMGKQLTPRAEMLAGSGSDRVCQLDVEIGEILSVWLPCKHTQHSTPASEVRWEAKVERCRLTVSNFIFQDDALGRPH